jgi:hypothetical protein
MRELAGSLESGSRNDTADEFKTASVVCAAGARFLNTTINRQKRIRAILAAPQIGSFVRAQAFRPLRGSQPSLTARTGCG